MKLSIFTSGVLAVSLLAWGPALADGEKHQHSQSGDQSGIQGSDPALSQDQAGTQGKDKPSGKRTGDQAMKQSDVSIRDINRNTSRYLNKRVSLSGQVEQVASGGNAFVLDGPGVFNDQILVVVQSQGQQKGGQQGGQAGTQMPSIQEDQKLQVSGTVKRLSVVDIERGYSTDLDPELEAEFEGSMPIVLVQPGDIQTSG